MNTFDKTIIEVNARRNQLALEAQNHRLLAAQTPRRSVTLVRRLVAHLGDALVAVGNRLKLPESSPQTAFRQLELN